MLFRSEPQFYGLLLEKLGLQDDPDVSSQEKSNWDRIRQRFAEIFKSKSRTDWCELMEGTDICFAPVLTMDEAIDHPHNKARAVFIEAFGVTQPGPAPRFTRTPGSIRRPPPRPGEHTAEVLEEWGIS